MARRGARMARWGMAAFAAAGVGCAGVRGSLPADAYIRNEIAAPGPPAAGPTAPPPAPPADEKVKVTPAPAAGELTLDDVLRTVSANFPLLLAVEQERQIAAGRRLSAEGAFDTTFRGGSTNQEGSFGNSRLDFGLEQPTPYNGLTTFAGYRLGLGDFPIYNGGQKTGNGGEFRAGFLLPLLRDGSIDRRRAAIRQARIAERLADPTIRRAELDALRAAARAYWAWVAAGERYRIQQELLTLAADRQKFLDTRVKVAKDRSQIDASENERSVLARRELVRAADLSLQQAALELSVFLCDAELNALVPTADRLPAARPEGDPPAPSADNLDADVRLALTQRPELQRLQLLRERAAIDRTLARNQMLPALNVGAAATQDLGESSKTFTGTGPFASDKTGVALSVSMDLPIQRRDARGRELEAAAVTNQLLLQEKAQQNAIRAEIQEAFARLEQTRQRLDLARRELAVAREVVRQGTALVQNALQDVLFLNIREFNAADAQTKVVILQAEYRRAYADYLTALGANPTAPPTLPPTPPAPEVAPPPNPK